MKKIENIDIYRIANGLVKQHGADTMIHAAMLVDERLDDGDLDGQARWKRVLAVVEKWQSKERPPAARVH